MPVIIRNRDTNWKFVVRGEDVDGNNVEFSYDTHEKVKKQPPNLTAGEFNRSE